MLQIKSLATKEMQGSKRQRKSNSNGEQHEISEALRNAVAVKRMRYWQEPSLINWFAAAMEARECAQAVIF